MQNISRNNVVLIEKTTLFIKKTGSKGETILRRGDRRRKKIIKDGQLITRSETEDRRVSSFSSLFVLVPKEPDLVAPIWSTAASAPLNHAPRQEQSVLHPASSTPSLSFLLRVEGLSSLIVNPTAVSLGKGGVNRRHRE